jgi:Retrotransposon gag protein/Zinc knuckle
VETALSRPGTTEVTRAPSPIQAETFEREEELGEMASQQFAEAFAQQGRILQQMMEQMRTMLKQSNDAVKAPKAFKGEMRDAERYMQACELFFKNKSNQFDGNERKKIVYALTNMEDKAVTWSTPYLGIYTEAYEDEETEVPFETWKEFREEFETSFGSADPAADARAGLENLQQKEKSISDYSHQFSLLSARSGYSDLDLKEKYRKGLHFRVKMALATKSYNSFKELRDAALMLERNMREMGIMPNSSPNTPRWEQARPTWRNPRPQYRDPNAMDIDATGRAPNNSYTNNRATGNYGLVNVQRCFNCKETGHFSNQCPKQTCFGCGKSGHYKRECPNPNNNRQGARVQATTMEDRGNQFAAMQQQMDTMAEGMASLMDTMELKKKEDF